MQRTAPASTLNVALDFLDLYPTAKLFPIWPQRKTPPLVTDNLEKNCSSDPAQIKKWHARTPGCNWGCALKASGWIAVDVDKKKGKQGQATFDALSLDHTEGFPLTLTVRTPSGGDHFYYKGPHIFALGAKGFGPDVDSPNYTLIPGCTLEDGSMYEITGADPVANAPAWFYEVLPTAKDDIVKADTSTSKVDTDKPENIEWFIHYLLTDAPPSVMGQNGELTVFKIAAVARGKGVSEEKCVELMAEHYNNELMCSPIWELDGDDGLRKKINNAYTYANLEAPGETTAEADFGSDPYVETPEEAAKSSKARDTNKKRNANVEAANVEDVLREWVWIVGQKRFVRRSDGIIWDREAFDSKYNFLTKNASISKALFNSRGGMRRLDSMIFRPGADEILTPLYNTWRKSEVTPAEGNTDVWNEHLNYLFQNEEDRNHVLNWLAWVYQHQSLKPNHALLIVGEEHGTGKSFIARVFEKLIGANNTKRPKNSSLKGDFNGWAAQCKLAIIEELMQIGRREVANELRDIITEPTIEVNMKNVSAFQIENYMALLAITNHTDAMPLEDSDRRWLVVKTHAQKRDGAYYSRLFKILHDPAKLAAVAYELQHRKLGEYDAHVSAPMNEAKAEMIEQGMTEVEQWLIENKGVPPLSYKLVTINDVIAGLPKRLERTPRLHNIIGAFLRRKMRGERLGQVRITDGVRQVLWAINGSGPLVKQAPSLAEIYLKERSGKTGPAKDDEEINDFTS